MIGIQMRLEGTKKPVTFWASGKKPIVLIEHCKERWERISVFLNRFFLYKKFSDFISIVFRQIHVSVLELMQIDLRFASNLGMIDDSNPVVILYAIPDQYFRLCILFFPLLSKLLTDHFSIPRKLYKRVWEFSLNRSKHSFRIELSSLHPSCAYLKIAFTDREKEERRGKVGKYLSVTSLLSFFLSQVSETRTKIQFWKYIFWKRKK